MTDRQKGVIDAIEMWWPGSSNRFCLRHIIANLRAKHRGNQSSDMVWKAAKSSNNADFQNAMREMQETDQDAYNYMMKIPTKHWSRHAFDEHVKSDHVTNNISECFNNWIDKFRTTSIDIVRKHAQSNNETNSQKA